MSNNDMIDALRYACGIITIDGKTATEDDLVWNHHDGSITVKLPDVVPPALIFGVSSNEESRRYKYFDSETTGMDGKLELIEVSSDGKNWETVKPMFQAPDLGSTFEQELDFNFESFKKTFQESIDAGYFYQAILEEPKCDCGAHAVNSEMHSTWCTLSTLEKI